MEGPPPVLHMRSQDVNVTSLIFLCAVEDYRVAQNTLDAYFFNHYVSHICMKIVNRKRLCNRAATFSVSVLVFLKNFANFSVVYS